jgi:hypothetical protein
MLLTSLNTNVMKKFNLKGKDALITVLLLLILSMAFTIFYQEKQVQDIRRLRYQDYMNYTKKQI